MYSTEEKQRIERVLAAFKEYIDGQNKFDILYSAKIGYLRICIDSKTDVIYECMQIESLDKLLDALFFEVSYDVIEQNLTIEYHDGLKLFPLEIAETRRRLLPILNTLGEDREYCIARMEHYLQHVND